MIGKSYEVVFVTGGAGGIGTAVWNEYQTSKRFVIVGDKLPPSQFKKLHDQDEVVGYVRLDLKNIDSIRQAREWVKAEYGCLAHLACVAGIAPSSELKGKGFEQTPIADLREVLEVNLLGHEYLIREFLPLMKEDTHKNKSITLVSSVNAIKNYEQPGYSASKGGLIGFMYGLCGELGRYGIRINTVCPGTTRTPLTEAEGKDFSLIEKGTLLGRTTTAEEVAKAIYACSHILTSCTGVVLPVDCGQSAKGWTSADVHKPI